MSAPQRERERRERGERERKEQRAVVRLLALRFKREREMRGREERKGERKTRRKPGDGRRTHRSSAGSGWRPLL